MVTTPEQQRRWKEAHPGYWAIAQRKWREAHPNYQRDFYHSTPGRKLRLSLRSSLLNAMFHRDGSLCAMPQWRSDSRIGALVGCSRGALIAHIEAQFLPGMSWSNHGKAGWELDHIKPCASFDLTKPDQQRRCFHYANLQPLWSGDNQRKHKRSN